MELLLFSLTRQSVGLGPVHPAAQCSLQQSMGEGPLHLLEHCCAQFSLVTAEEQKSEGEQQVSLEFENWKMKERMAKFVFTACMQ